MTTVRYRAEELDDLPKRRRAALVNSISGFKPANLIGTCDRDRRSNLAIMTSLVHLGSAPPLLGLILRPDSVERHTLANIRNTGAYTVNHVHSSFFEAAHQTSARYPRERSEFAETGLTEDWLPDFAAPFVAQAKIRVGMKLEEELPLKINGTFLLIGSVQVLEAPESAFDAGGALDLQEADSVAVSGLDTYYAAQRLARLSYAKVDEGLQILK